VFIALNHRRVTIRAVFRIHRVLDVVIVALIAVIRIAFVVVVHRVRCVCVVREKTSFAIDESIAFPSSIDVGLPNQAREF
jgi:hypothetical protein